VQQAQYNLAHVHRRPHRLKRLEIASYVKELRRIYVISSGDI
jgi:hypothetical protein